MRMTMRAIDLRHARTRAGFAADRAQTDRLAPAVVVNIDGDDQIRAAGRCPGVCVEQDRPGRTETAPQSFRYDAAAGGGCTNGTIYGSIATLNTHKYGAAQ